MNPRSILILCRCAPYGTARARDWLDAALAFGAFEQAVSLLLVGDGVLTLAQPGASPGPLPRLAGTLPDYGIAQVFVDRLALAERGLDACAMAVPVTPLDDDGIAALIADHDVVLTI